MQAVFLAIMFVVGCFVSAVVTFRWTAMTELNMLQKSLIFMILTGMFLAPFLLKSPPRFMNGKEYYILLYIAYFLFVCLFLFFCFLFVRDGLWIIARWFGKGPAFMDPTAVLKANIGLLMVVVVLSGYALWEGMRVPEVKEIHLVSDKIKSPVTLVVLSDVHLSRLVSCHKIQGMVKQVNALNPDVILLPGDIVDDDPKFIAPLVAEMRGLKAPAYVTDGNHELYNGRETAHREFKKAGLIYLENEGFWFRPDLWIGGVPDIQVERAGYKIEMAKAMPEKEGYTILMAHSPGMFDMPGNRADLQVSGHTHGGQIFPMHFLTKLANYYLAGLYLEGGRYVYVSRGSGQWGPQMRLFAPSEITLIKIYPDKTDFK